MLAIRLYSKRQVKSMKKEPPTPQKSLGPPLENLTKVIFVVLGALFSLILLVFTIRLLLWSQWTVDPPSSTVQGRKFRDPRMKNMFLVLPSILKTSGNLLRTTFGKLEKCDFCSVGALFSLILLYGYCCGLLTPPPPPCRVENFATHA